MKLREDCEEIVRRAIAAVQPDAAVRRALEGKSFPAGRLVLTGTRIFHFGSLSLTRQPAREATRTAVELAREKGIITESQSSEDMEKLENITSVAGLEDLQVQADGMVTLNRDQLEALNSALQEAAGAEELQTRVSALEAENTQLRGEISARDSRIQELENAIAEDGQGADGALHGDGGQQFRGGAGSGDSVSAARAYMEEYRKRNAII